MSRSASIHRPALVSLALFSVAAAWWGCANASSGDMTQATTTSSSSSSGSSGSGGTGGVNFDGGSGGGDDEGGACTSTSASAHHIPVDMIFLIDQSGSMHGVKWMGITAALNEFVNDPASISIGAGLVLFPDMPWDCDPQSYEALTVPIGVLPTNAFAVTNAMPADAKGTGTPMYGALEGALLAATSYQDAHPTHKVALVLATDGDPNGLAGCDNSVPDIAGLAQSALDYDGVLTYVIGCAGSTIANLDEIAAAGGTTAAYDVTNDITLFAASIAQIREATLGCDFEIPPAPNGQALNPDDVNFSYTPKGMGMGTTLLRVKDVADCNGQPGWYYDDNTSPTKITLCPASCSTVQADTAAKVDVLFGCKSLFR